MRHWVVKRSRLPHWILPSPQVLAARKRQAQGIMLLCLGVFVFAEKVETYEVQ